MAEVFIRSIDELDIDSVWDQLSDMRKEKIKRLKNKKQALLSAAAELALSDAIRKWFPNSELPVKYTYDENGKPYLTELNAYISLSHSGRLAVCAISENEIGVDIQTVRRADMRVARRFFSEEENELIRGASDKDRAFFEIWVKKEAYVKLTGEGISGGFAVSNRDKTREYGYDIRYIEAENSLLCTCERKMYKNS